MARHGVTSIAIIGIGLVSGCSSGSTDSPVVAASTSASASVPVVNVVADENMKIALRNYANCEEAYYTDAGAYGTAAQLTTCPKLQLPAGGVVTVHLDPSTGFCLAGRVAAGRYWIYDSTKGGLAAQPASSDSCDPNTFAKAGGTVQG